MLMALMEKKDYLKKWQVMSAERWKESKGSARNQKHGTEMKNAFDGPIGKLDSDEEKKISHHEDRSIETS